MFNYKDYKVFLACGNTTMRKSINGLCEIVQHNFALNPSEKIIFEFCNRPHNRIKLLVWLSHHFFLIINSTY